MFSRAIVLEPYASGHRPSYVRWVAAACLRASLKTTVVGGSALFNHDEVARLRRQDTAQLLHTHVLEPPSVTHFESKLALIRNEGLLRRWCARAYASVDPRPQHDIVLLPFADYCFHTFALQGVPFLGAPWCGITMKTEFPSSEEAKNGSNAVRLMLLRALLARRTTRAIFSIDPRATTFIGKRQGCRLHYLPDPAELSAVPNKSEARRSLNIDKARKVILLFGSIDPRKGLGELVDGASLLPDAQDWTVLIAGKQTDAAKALLLNRGKIPCQSIMMDRYIDAETTSTLLGAADVVWAGYPSHKGMSGVLVQAALAGRAVIASAGSLVGDLVEKHGIGVVCDVRSPQAVRTALQASLDPRILQKALTLGPAAFGAHQPLEFGRRLLDVLRAAASH